MASVHLLLSSGLASHSVSAWGERQRQSDFPISLFPPLCSLIAVVKILRGKKHIRYDQNISFFKKIVLLVILLNDLLMMSRAHI